MDIRHVNGYIAAIIPIKLLSVFDDDVAAAVLENVDHCPLVDMRGVKVRRIEVDCFPQCHCDTFLSGRLGSKVAATTKTFVALDGIVG
jgi:hypothetical protein